jgi:hypothetical protein
MVSIFDSGRTEIFERSFFLSGKGGNEGQTMV